MEQIVPAFKSKNPIVANSLEASDINQTANVITERVDSLIFRTPNLPSLKPAEIKLENNFTTETNLTPKRIETIDGVRANINAILSLSSGNTRISVIQG